MTARSTGCCGAATRRRAALPHRAGCLRRDPIAGFALAAGLLGGIATAPRESPPPPAAIYRGAQLPASSTAPALPTGAMPT